MSILILKEQHKLSLSDSLRKFFPQLPYSGITIRHLLTHTSGLPDYFSPMLTDWDHNKVAFNADMIRFLAQLKRPVRFKPGQKWQYSNTAYALLASIVEQVSGVSFAQFTAQYIFKPLGMSRSRAYNTRRTSSEEIPDYAYGYVYADSLNRYLVPDSLPNLQFVYYMDGIQGDGTVNSTVGDLLKWDRAIRNHALLSKAMQEEMVSGQVLADTVTKWYYGYGIGVGQRDNKNCIGHGGTWPGYRTNLIRYLDEDITINVLSNYESKSYDISQTLADILLDKPVMFPRK